MTPRMKRTIIGIANALVFGVLFGLLISTLPVAWGLKILFSCAAGALLYAWITLRPRP